MSILLLLPVLLPLLAGAVVLYLVPLALFFAGYLLGDALWGMGPLMGCLAFVLGFCIAMLYDRLVARKQKTVYTIVRFGKRPKAH